MISFMEFSRGMRKWMEQRPAFVMLRPQQRKALFDAFHKYVGEGNDRMNIAAMKKFIAETDVFAGVVPEEEKGQLLEQMKVGEDCFMNFPQVGVAAAVGGGLTCCSSSIRSPFSCSARSRSTPW